jgi:hypothetical protein
MNPPKREVPAISRCRSFALALLLRLPVFLQDVTFLKLAIAGLLMAALFACAKVSLPPQVDVSEIQPSGRAAKPPDCNMPVLRSDPLTDFRKVAIIDATANTFENEGDVLPAVQRAACGTGADAIVITKSKAQTSEGLVGYYLGAYAIIYGRVSPSVVEGGATSSH